MSQEPGSLTHARYGKDLVRVLRVVREGAWHHVVEYNVKALVEGEIETRWEPFIINHRLKCHYIVSYTKADNSCVVATDSIKNITYCTDHTPTYRPTTQESYLGLTHS
jgi:urate oxidase